MVPKARIMDGGGLSSPLVLPLAHLEACGLDNIAKRVSRGTFLFLVFATALLIWNGNMTAVEIKDFAIQIIYLLILGVSTFRFLFNRRLIVKIDSITVVAALYGLLLLATYLQTGRNSLNYKAIIPQLCGIITFLIVIHYFSKDDIKLLLRLCLATAVICSAYGILQYFGIDFVQWTVTKRRLAVTSFFGHKNCFGIYLLLMIPFAIKELVQSQKILAITINVLVTGIIIFALILSNSRGAFIGFFLSVLLFTMLTILKRGPHLLKSLRALFPLFTLPLIFVMTFMFLPHHMQKDYLRIAGTSGDNGRVKLFRATLEIIKEHPLWGVGPGNLLVFYPKNEEHKLNASNPNSTFRHAHNDFLDIWAESGIFAVMAYCVFIALVALRLVKKVRNAGDYVHKSTLIAFLCSLAGYLFYSLFTVAGQHISSLFYFWLILGIAYLQVKGSGDSDHVISAFGSFQKGRIVGFTGAVVVGCFFILAAKTILTNYVSDVHIKKANTYSLRGQYDAAIDYLNAAIALQPKSVDAYYQRGFASFYKNDIEQSLLDYKRVNEMAPNYVNTCFNLATCYYKNRDWTSSIEMAKDSLELFPHHKGSLALLTKAYMYSGQTEMASKYLERLIKNGIREEEALNLKKRLRDIIQKKKI